MLWVWARLGNLFSFVRLVNDMVGGVEIFEAKLKTKVVLSACKKGLKNTHTKNQNKRIRLFDYKEGMKMELGNGR